MGTQLTANRLATIAKAAHYTDEKIRHNHAHGEGIFTTIHELISRVFDTQFSKDLELKHQRIDKFVDALFALKGYLETGSSSARASWSYIEYDKQHQQPEDGLLRQLQSELQRAFSELCAGQEFTFKVARLASFKRARDQGPPSNIRYQLIMYQGQQELEKHADFIKISDAHLVQRFNALPETLFDYTAYSDSTSSSQPQSELPQAFSELCDEELSFKADPASFKGSSHRLPSNIRYQGPQHTDSLALIGGEKMEELDTASEVIEHGPETLSEPGLLASTEEFNKSPVRRSEVIQQYATEQSVSVSTEENELAKKLIQAQVALNTFKENYDAKYQEMYLKKEKLLKKLVGICSECADLDTTICELALSIAKLKEDAQQDKKLETTIETTIYTMQNQQSRLEELGIESRAIRKQIEEIENDINSAEKELEQLITQEGQLRRLNQQRSKLDEGNPELEEVVRPLPPEPQSLPAIALPVPLPVQVPLSSLDLLKEKASGVLTRVISLRYA